MPDQLPVENTDVPLPPKETADAAEAVGESADAIGVPQESVEQIPQPAQDSLFDAAPDVMPGTPVEPEPLVAEPVGEPVAEPVAEAQKAAESVPQMPQAPSVPPMGAAPNNTAPTNPAIAGMGMQMPQNTPPQYGQQQPQYGQQQTAGGALSGGAKAGYIVLGFMVGLIGVLIAWLIGRNKPEPARGTKYALIGWGIAVVFSVILMSAGYIAPGA